MKLFIPSLVLQTGCGFFLNQSSFVLLTRFPAWVAHSPAPLPPDHRGPGPLAPNCGDHGPSDSTLAVVRGGRLGPSRCGAARGSGDDARRTRATAWSGTGNRGPLGDRLTPRARTGCETPAACGKGGERRTKDVHRIFRRSQKEDGAHQQHTGSLTREEPRLLLHTCQEQFPLYYPFLSLLARTGVRFGEALGLQWGDIDFQGRFIEVRRTLSHHRLSTPKERERPVRGYVLATH
jgi:hypothetical protein